MNIEENVSRIKYSVVVDRAEQCEKLTIALNNALEGMRLAFTADAEELPGTNGKLWYAYEVAIRPQDFHAAQTCLIDFGCNLVSSPEKCGLEPGESLTTSAAELLINEQQSEEASGIEGQAVEAHTLLNIYTLSVRNRLLLARIGQLEAQLEALNASHVALADNVRGQKVMNFDYNQFHKLPYLIKAMVETIGDEKLQKTFDDLFDEPPFELVKIH